MGKKGEMPLLTKIFFVSGKLHFHKSYIICKMFIILNKYFKKFSVSIFHTTPVDKNHINNCVENHCPKPYCRWAMLVQSVLHLLTGQKRNGILIVSMKYNIVTEQINMQDFYSLEAVLCRCLHINITNLS